MRKITTWLLLFFLVATAAAQDEEFESTESRFNFGGRLGISTSHIDGDGYTGFRKFGLGAGLFTNLDISPKVNVQLEMLYIQKGSRRNDTLAFNYYRIALNYIQVPLMFRFNYSRFLIEVGPSFGVLVGDSEEDFNGEVNQSVFGWHRFETSINIGMHFSITEQLSSNVRYSRSILPVSDEVQVDPRFGLIGGAYNEVIEFNLFYTVFK